MCRAVRLWVCCHPIYPVPGRKTCWSCVGLPQAALAQDADDGLGCTNPQGELFIDYKVGTRKQISLMKVRDLSQSTRSGLNSKLSRAEVWDYFRRLSGVPSPGRTGENGENIYISFENSEKSRTSLQISEINS